MGVWEHNLYSNDCFCDVVDIYKNNLRNSFNRDIALEKTLVECDEYLHSDFEPIVWFALADIQWQFGEISEKVKEKTISLIDEGKSIDLVKDDMFFLTEWQKELRELKNRIQSPIPKKEMPEKQISFLCDNCQIGEIYTYRLNNGSYIVFEVIGKIESYNSIVVPIIQVYNKIFNHIVNLNELSNVEILPLDNPERFFTNNEDDRFFPLNLYAIMNNLEIGENKINRFTYIGDINLKNELCKFEYDYNAEHSWDEIDDWFMYYYTLWSNYCYECSEGTYIVKERGN